MTSKALIPGSSHYTMRYPSCRIRDTGSAALVENQRPPSRRRDSAARQVPPAISDSQARFSTSSGIQVQSYSASAAGRAASDSHHNSVPQTRNLRHSPSPQFNVTTDCDSISDVEEPTSPRTEEDRYRRSIAPPAYDDETSDDSEMDFDARIEAERAIFGSSANIRRENRCLRGRRRAEPNPIESAVLGNVSFGGENIDKGGSDRVQASGEQGVDTASLQSTLLRPIARFFIQKDKDIVSVKFDPPVSVTPFPIHYHRHRSFS